MLELAHVDLDRVGRELGDQLPEQRQRLGLEIDLLEVGVHEAVEGLHGPVGRLPGDVEHVRGVGEGVALGVRHDPVQLAPAGLRGRLVPGQHRGLAPTHQRDRAGGQLVTGPRDRGAAGDQLPVALRVPRVAAELDL